MLEQQLAHRNNDRLNLLQKTIDLVNADPHLRAAWLFGSTSRQEEDALSDIDLWLVVDDDQFPGLLKMRHDTIEQVGTPLFVLDVPGNAPIDGGYLMVQYAGTEGPIQVDWYWQPLSKAQIPDDAEMLFDRTGLPRAEGTNSIDVSYLSQGIKPPPSGHTPSHGQQLHYRMTFFWCLLLIAAKKIIRRDLEEADKLLGYTKHMLGQAHELVGSDDKQPAQTTVADRGEDAYFETLSDAYTALLAQHEDMKTLLPYLTAVDIHFHANALPSVDHFLALAKPTLL